MANKRKQFTPEFKQSAIDFVNAHPEMTVLQCANHLEIGLSTLQRWKREAKENPGQPVPFVGSGNYSSEIEKENIRLQKELRDTQEALKILKKPSAFWEINTNPLSACCTGTRCGDPLLCVQGAAYPQPLHIRLL